MVFTGFFIRNLPPRMNILDMPILIRLYHDLESVTLLRNDGPNPIIPLDFLGLATQLVQYGGLLEPIVVFVFGMHHLLHISQFKIRLRFSIYRYIYIYIVNYECIIPNHYLTTFHYVHLCLKSEKRRFSNHSSIRAL